jgi:TP901 family phage tail tape measure protein
MADVNANIGVNIDTSQALAQLKSLQRQISQFHTSIAKSSETAAIAQQSLSKNLINSINSIGAFSAELRTVKTTSESFTNSLEKNKFSMREYFRYAGGATKTFGKLFRSEFDTISNVAEERVKRLQTQYIKLGRDSSGAMKSIAVMPTSLNMEDYNTKLQIAAQRQQLFNQLMRQGSTNLINFGKNTQWAGRQLMVGFTIPLSILGNTASRAFMDMETQAIKFKKVYGDLFTPKEETQQALADVQSLASMFTQYGIAASQTVGLAAEAAAAGFSGVDLQRQTAEATRLSVLGQIDAQKALETTISLQNAFKMSSDQLAGSINFLNAVENQTVVSLDDITTAIPKVAPIIQQLGGDVKDLAFFMAAMKEGGVNASEGANALKSGLAALINPTEKASAMLAGMGINIKGIIETNKGDLKNTVVEFARSLDTLDPLTRARAIEQLFGKFQFARLSTLFANVIQDGNQASRVLNLAGSTIEELSQLAEQELELTAGSSMNKFKKAVEDLKIALVPVGETFLSAITPIVDFIGAILEKFNNLSSGAKRVITILTVGLGAVGPVLLMTFGLLANGIGNLIKLFLTLRGGYQRLTGQTNVLGQQTQYMTSEQLDAAAAAHSLDQAHAKLTQQFLAEAGAVMQLRNAYLSAIKAGQNFSLNNPGSMLRPKKFAQGVVSVPGSGNRDTVPAMLTPGEAVIPKKMAQKYGGLINGMISDNIPGFKKGLGVGDLKKSLGLFRAPYAVMKQTGGMTWDTLPAELEAVERAASEILNKTVSDVQKVNERLGNLKRKQASHIVPDVTSVQMGGSQVDIKNWNAKNLQADLGYVNAYINTIQQSNTIIENFNKQHLDKAAQTLNMSIDEVSQELTKFKQGIHSNNRKSAQVLQQVAMTDPGYQGQAAAAGLGVRLSGNYYETLGSRQYDPAKNINAAKTVDKKIQRLERELILRSEAMGTSAVNATAKAAGTASPSKKTIKIGEDIARGLEVGMQNRQGNVAKVSKQLGETAVTKSGLIVPKSAVGGSAPLSSLSSSAAFTESAIKGTETVNKMAVFNERMSRMNNIIMGSTFALTSLAGVGSMAGGALGEFSSTIFKYSGLLFGLMSITQLLTQAKIAELAATRLSIASNAVKAAGGGMGIAGRGLAARSGILGIIGKLSVGLRAFLGPIGIATTVVAGLVIGFRKYNQSQEEARRKVLAFGNALTTSKKQAESTGDYFGVSVQKSNLEKDISSQMGSGRYNTEIRKKLDDFQASDTFKKDYEETVKDLKILSDSEAKTALLVRIQNLMGQGYSEEQIQIIISSLQEAAGKTAIKLNFKDLKVDSINKDVLAGLQPKLAELAKFDGGKGLTGSIRTTYDKETGITTKTIYQTKEFSLALENVGMSVKAVMTNLSLLQTQGKISTKDLQQSFNGLMYNIKNSTQDSGTQVLLFNKALEGMDNPLAKAAILTDDLTKKTKLMNAAILGAVIPTAMLNAYLFGGSGLYSEGILSVEIDKIIAKAGELNDKFKKAMDATTTKPGGGEDNWLTKLGKEAERLTAQTAAFYKLRDAGFSFAESMELASNPEFAKGINDAAKGGEKSWNAAVAAIKKYREEQEKLKLAEIAGMDQGDYELQRLNKAQAYIDLQSHFIKMEYSAQLESISKSQEENDLLLQRIGYQETLINNRYNPIIDRLQKIESLNKSISEIESRRLDVVSALSSGDISGGVKALQELRATRAAQTSQSQIDNLNAAREREVSLLTQNNLTRDQIDLQNQKLSLDRREIELTISKKENALTYFNMTKTQIDNAARALDLAKSAGVDINSPSFLTNVLDAALGKTKSLKLAADEAAASFAAMLGKQEAARATNIPTAAPTITTIPQLFTTTGVGGTKITTPWDTGAGSPIRRSMGGIVPKYFANGGMSRGTDTIPAMLTPGEYVVRKSAVDALGVGAMNNINNGKASSNSVYNYSLSVNVDGTSANANDIARVVMSEIKKVDQQRIRGIR